MKTKINIRNINASAKKADAEVTELAQQFADLKSDIIRTAKASNGAQEDWWINLNGTENESTSTFAFETGDNRKPITKLSVQKESLGDAFESAEFDIFAGRHGKLAGIRENLKGARRTLAGFTKLQEAHAKANSQG